MPEVPHQWSPDAERALRDLLQAHPALRDEWTENHKLRNDPRITAIGRFLRLTSFDELPQLWNVIRGEMSRGQRPRPMRARGAAALWAGGCQLPGGETGLDGTLAGEGP